MPQDDSTPFKATGLSLTNFLVPFLIVAASLAIRVAALIHWGGGPIESEGAEYARIAENLRRGVGYVGIVTPGPEINFPPLFPWLIAAASFLTSSYTLAGRLVSLLFGAFLPLSAFGIASRLFNRRVALVTAALFILHPLFISLSVTVLSEGAYATLVLSAVYVVLCAMDLPSLLMWSLVGAVFGIAYLLRPEAVAPLAIAAAFAITSTNGPFLTRSRRAGIAVLVFLVLASPEVIYLYRTTGKVRLEAKSAITSRLAILILDREQGAATRGTPAAQPEEATKWASAAVDRDLRRIGIWLRPEDEVVRDLRITPKDLIRIVSTAIRENTPALLEVLRSRWLGAPFLPALALLGAFSRPWRAPVALGRLYFVLVPTTAILASFAVLWLFSRFYFVLVPFLLIWAANALVEIGQWTEATLVALHWTWFKPNLAAYILPIVLGLAVLTYPAKAIRSLYEFQEGSPANHAVKDAGLWIHRQQGGPITIMDRYTTLAFHADANFVYYPYCDGDVALRFLDAANVDYVVLRRDEKFTPYYDDWFEKGIPDSRAELVYTSSGLDAGRIVVYRWHRTDGPFGTARAFKVQTKTSPPQVQPIGSSRLLN